MDSFLAGIKSGQTTTLTLPSGVVLKSDGKKKISTNEFLKARKKLQEMNKGWKPSQSGGMCNDCSL